MPFTRRLFIERSGAAAAALAIPVTGTGPAAAAALPFLGTGPGSAENAELLAIGAEIGPAMKRFEDAETKLDKARERALAAAPAIPDGLPLPFGSSIFGQISWYSLPEPTNILGEPIELPNFVSAKTGRELPVRIPRAQDILNDRRQMARLASIPAWHRGEHRRLYDLAVQFERATDEARAASGLDNAEIEIRLAGAAIVDLCRRANAIEVRTLAGIVVKAQAIDACAEIPGQAARAAVHHASTLLPFAICCLVAGETE